jgi:hypothetical protein
MFLRRQIPSRSWSRYLRENTHKKLNNCRRTTTTTTTAEEEEEEEEEGNEVEGKDDED